MGIEEILREKGIYIGKIKGDSMFPMLREERDRVIVVTPKFPLKKYDVPVYRRDQHYTMHRIVKVAKDGKYIICGDNRTRLERDITENEIIGVLAGFYRDDIYFSCNDEKYIKYAKRICRQYYIRLLKRYITAIIRRIKKK